MSKETLTFTTDLEKREALDRVAKALARDRGDLIREALDAWLDANARYIARIEEGVRQADAGEFAAEDEVRKAFSR